MSGNTSRVRLYPLSDCFVQHVEHEIKWLRLSPRERRIKQQDVPKTWVGFVELTGKHLCGKSIGDDEGDLDELTYDCLEDLYNGPDLKAVVEAWKRDAMAKVASGDVDDEMSLGRANRFRMPRIRWKRPTPSQQKVRTICNDASCLAWESSELSYTLPNRLWCAG